MCNVVEYLHLEILLYFSFKNNKKVFKGRYHYTITNVYLPMTHPPSDISPIVQCEKLFFPFMNNDIVLPIIISYFFYLIIFVGNYVRRQQ